MESCVVAAAIGGIIGCLAVALLRKRFPHVITPKRVILFSLCAFCIIPLMGLVCPLLPTLEGC